MRFVLILAVAAVAQEQNTAENARQDKIEVFFQFSEEDMERVTRRRAESELYLKAYAEAALADEIKAWREANNVQDEGKNAHDVWMNHWHTTDPDDQAAVQQWAQVVKHVHGRIEDSIRNGDESQEDIEKAKQVLERRDEDFKKQVVPPEDPDEDDTNEADATTAGGATLLQGSQYDKQRNGFKKTDPNVANAVPSFNDIDTHRDRFLAKFHANVMDIEETVVRLITNTGNILNEFMQERQEMVGETAADGSGQRIFEVVQGVAGTNECPTDPASQPLDDATQCSTAAVLVGKTYDKETLSADLPTGCFFHQTSNNVEFNTHSSGQGAANYVPLCQKTPLLAISQNDVATVASGTTRAKCAVPAGGTVAPKWTCESAMDWIESGNTCTVQCADFHNYVSDVQTLTCSDGVFSPSDQFTCRLKAEWPASWQAYDLDGDHMLNATEVGKAQDDHPDLTGEDNWMSEFDANNDNRLSYEEMKDDITKYENDNAIGSRSLLDDGAPRPRSAQRGRSGRHPSDSSRHKSHALLRNEHVGRRHVPSA